MQKKKSKKPLHNRQVPGPKLFFTTIFTPKDTLSPGTGGVPGFFFCKFFALFSWSICIFLGFEKKLVGNHFQFCPIKSSFKQYLRHLYLDIY